MFPEKQKKEKRRIRMTIFLRLLLVSIFFTVIPLLITNFLINSAYQNGINEVLSSQRGEKEIIQSLYRVFLNVKIQSFLTLLVIIILVLFGVITLARNITKPLRKIIAAMKKVIEGNFDVKLKIDSRDEFQDVADYFNEMIYQLKHTRSALEEAKTSLEIKVEARTKELQELTKSLEEKIKERTKELEERVDQLEKLHRLTVGRELRMIELKEEIKELKEKLRKKK